MGGPHRYVDILLTMTHVGCQAFADGEHLQAGAGLGRDWQGGRLIDLESRQQVPGRSAKVFTGGAMVPERIDLRTIRLPRHEDHLGGGDEIPRQLRWPMGNDRIAIEIEVKQVVLHGIPKEIVSFIDDDAVRRARAASHDVESRQH